MAATQLVGEMEVLAPLAGLIDKDAETARVNKEIDKIKKDFARVEEGNPRDLSLLIRHRLRLWIRLSLLI